MIVFPLFFKSGRDERVLASGPNYFRRELDTCFVSFSFFLEKSMPNNSQEWALRP
jgi:hypothetical protein